jgi:hypothetical protein
MLLGALLFDFLTAALQYVNEFPDQFSALAVIVFFVDPQT